LFNTYFLARLPFCQARHCLLRLTITEMHPYYKYPNGDEVYNVTIMYLSRDWRGEVSLNDEHTEWNWFAVDQIPEDVSPPIKPIIEHFKRRSPAWEEKR